MTYNTGVLNPHQLVQLLDVLSDDNIDNTSLANLQNKLQNSFIPKDSLKVASALAQFLEDEDLLSSQNQRIAALSLLFGLCDELKLYSTFASLLSQLVTKGSDKESHLLCLFLNGKGKEFSTFSATQVVKNEAKLSACPNRKDILDKLKVLPESNEKFDEGRKLEALSKPTFVRPAPPPLLTEDELMWINPEEFLVDQLKFLYDPSMCETKASAVNECRRLLSKALKGPLNLTQLDQLSAVVKKVDSAIVAAGVTPAQYPELVEYNPVIAYDVLICLMSTNQITDYFSVLVNMDMSLHSMEVVNRLTTTVELPTEFVHLYISNCINTCESIKDKYIQNRYTILNFPAYFLFVYLLL